jgi:hypothetical protein
VITPRATRLLRVADPHELKDTLAGILRSEDPLAARDQLVIVPTRAAAVYLRRALEGRLLSGQTCMVLPELITRDELAPRFAERLSDCPRRLNGFEREVLLAAASRQAAENGTAPPFRVRPGLVAEMLEFYDALRRQRVDVNAFERLMLGALEPGAAFDRGAERLVRQTRFLVATFREFEQLTAAANGADEHRLRQLVVTIPSARPWRHVVVAIRDIAATPHGLWSGDFDLLTRVPGLERLDVVLTESALGDGLRERLEQELPGLEELSPSQPRPLPALLVPAQGVLHAERDREEEVMQFARRVRSRANSPHRSSDDRTVLIVRRPLPYLYLAREVLASASLPCQVFDALPLAAEPFAAALDLVCSCIESNVSRPALVALLKSPHFRFSADGALAAALDVVCFDRLASEAGYLGGEQALSALVASWQHGERGAQAAAARAGMIALGIVRQLAVVSTSGPPATHLQHLLDFLTVNSEPPRPDDAEQHRHVRARQAVLSTVMGLRDAYGRHDQSPRPFVEVARVVRRWIESQTFSPRTGFTGVHIADADSAVFGDFDHAQIAGLVEDEWPQRPKRNIFYSPGLLHQLRWPAEPPRVAGERALFKDLLALPAVDLVASGFLLENDAIVTPSPLLEELEEAAFERVRECLTPASVFRADVLLRVPPLFDRLGPVAAEWGRLRAKFAGQRAARQRGCTAPPPGRAYSLSALERYQDCPFKFFAADVLQLDEPPEDQTTLSPRVRGRFVHEVFQRFFEEWDRGGGGAISPDCVDAARARFIDVAEELLQRLPAAEASLERARLFGSPAAVGIVDVVLDLEASNREPVTARLLEHRLEGEFSLGVEDGRRAQLRGVVDRVDLLAGRRLRVIDYKTGSAPNPKRALQVPVYALCVSERLTERDGAAWSVDAAEYVAFAGKRQRVPVIKSGASSAHPPALASARDRTFDALDGIARGEFPPRPYDMMICNYCVFSGVCRKDYVGDE